MLDRIRRKLRVDLTPFVLSTARRGGGNGSRNLHSPSYVHSIVCILASSTRVASMLFCEGVYYISSSILEYIHCLYDSYSYANYIIYSTSVVYISTSLA